MTQLVSILIPVFNSQQWIRACIQSALAQTWPRKEIIVVDDGSRDATLQVARALASENVKVAAQENRGASAARNHALSLAQGDYIQWLDADDLLAPDKIARQLEGAEPGAHSRLLLSGAWGRFLHCTQRARFQPDPLWADLEPAEWLFRKLDQNLWMAIESWLVSRQLTTLAGNWNEDLYRDNDGEYFCRVLSASHGIRFIPEARCFCRRNTTTSISHSMSLSDKKLESLAVSLRLYVERLTAMEDSPRTRTAGQKLLQRWAIYFYPERPDLFAQLRQIAERLGGALEDPVLPAKYRWMQKTLGWRVAKRAQAMLPTARARLEGSWDWLMCLRHSGER